MKRKRLAILFVFLMLCISACGSASAIETLPPDFVPIAPSVPSEVTDVVEAWPNINYFWSHADNYDKPIASKIVLQSSEGTKITVEVDTDVRYKVEAGREVLPYELTGNGQSEILEGVLIRWYDNGTKFQVWWDTTRWGVPVTDTISEENPHPYE